MFFVTAGRAWETLLGTGEMAMPKDANSARRQDAQLLVLLADIPHSEAVQRLNGKRGRDVAEEAIRTVGEFWQAVKVRAEVMGASSGKAKAVLLKELELLPRNSAFPIVQEEDTSWFVMHGVYVRCERRLGRRAQYLAGVLLPPEATNSPYRLRIALTEPSRRRQLGDVVALDARRWSMTPSLGDVSAGSTPTRCPADRPLYMGSELPGGILATQPELRLRRLIPAHGQAPIATHRTAPGRRASPLYAIADSVPIPPKSPQQARAILRSRTCATCNDSSATPFPGARDGRHYCAAHLDEAQARVVRAERARERAASVVWARTVMQDPATMLLVLRYHEQRELSVHIANIDGGIQTDYAIPSKDIPSQFDLFRKSNLNEIPSWVLESATRILGCRTVLAAENGAENAYQNLLSAAGIKLERRQLYSAPRDRLGYRYKSWNRDGCLDADFYSMIKDSTDITFRHRQELETDASAVIAKMRAMLMEMARTDLPADQAKHAEIYLQKKPRPTHGRAAYYAESQNAVSPSNLMRFFGDDN